MKKYDRGSYDYRSDGNIITVASNHFKVTPVQKITRRDKSENKKEVTQPNIISKYNYGMGGVDLADRFGVLVINLAGDQENGGGISSRTLSIWQLLQHIDFSNM